MQFRTFSKSPVLPRALRHWLAVSGSLSQHLEAVGSHYRVQPLRQRGLRLLPAEKPQLGCAPGARHWGREALLNVDEQPLVLARSVTLATAAQGSWRAMRSLGTRPLAELLFGSKRVHRQSLQALRLSPASPWHAHARRTLTAQGAWPASRVGGLWMRRTLFTRSAPRQALLVQEVFLPVLANYTCPRLNRPG